MIIAVVNVTLQLRKESLKKIQACTGFEPLTSAIPVQHSTNNFFFQAFFSQLQKLRV